MSSKRSGKARARSRSPAPPRQEPPHRNWRHATPAYREEAKAVLAARRGGGGRDAVGLARTLMQRYPSSPLALHIFGYVLASAGARMPPKNPQEESGMAGLLPAALRPLQLAVELAPTCLEIAYSLAMVHRRMLNPAEAAAVCRRALAVSDPGDPAMHAAGGKELMATNHKARIAVARERLRGLLDDADRPITLGHIADAAAAAAAEHWDDMTDAERIGFVSVNIEKLKAFLRSIRLSHGQ